MTVINIKGKREKTLEDYFKISPPGIFAKWQSFLFEENISQLERHTRYNMLKDDISKLKILFKKRTRELNEVAQKEGFSNRIDFALAFDQIPKEKWIFFTKNIDNFIATIMSDEIPIQKLMKEETDWNMFNTPFPLGSLWPSDKFEIPNEVIGLIAAYDKRILEYIDQIDIKYEKDIFYTITKYNSEKKNVEIKVKDCENDIFQVLAFVGALGLAIEMLNLANSDKDPKKMSKYLSKQIMIEHGHQFLKHYVPIKHQKLIRYNTLSSIAATLFEIDIFTNEKQDFDKAYAKAIRRCYPMTNQEENPFYVYYERFIIRPMGELTSSIIEMEMYLKETKSLQK